MPAELPTVTPGTKTAARRLFYQRNLSEFIPRELSIRTKGIGVAAFVPNVVQIPILEGAQKQLRETGKIRLIIFKCRQPGTSTLASGIIWHKTSMFAGVNSFIVAQDKTTVARIFNMHDLFYKRMSPDVRPQRKYFTKGTQITLGDEQGGITSDILVGEAKNINLGVGSTIHCLHLSEIARYPSESALTESLLPACSDFPGTIRIIESTAHFGGCADYFRDQCQRAIQGRGEYQYHFVQWWKLPEYATPLLPKEKLKLDAHSEYPHEKQLVRKLGLSLENIKWRRSKIDEYRGDVDMFYLSYPTDFEEGWITKDASAFPYGRLTEMQQYLRPPSRRFSIAEGKVFADDNGLLHVWKMPEPGKIYDVGGDVAGGDGSTDGIDNAKTGDFSVAEVVERITLEQCAEWRGHVLPREFGDVLAAIGRMYNTAQVGSEVNSFGMSTLERLRDSYTNLYLWRKRDGVVEKFTGKFGWMTTYESKNLIVNLMREKLYYHQVIIHSKTLWDEARNFVRDFTPTGMITYAAATGYDDCIMAFMIAIQISEDENFEKYKRLSVRDEVAEKPKAPRPEDAFIDANWQSDLDQIDDGSLKVDVSGWK